MAGFVAGQDRPQALPVLFIPLHLSVPAQWLALIAAFNTLVFGSFPHPPALHATLARPCWAGHGARIFSTTCPPATATYTPPHYQPPFAH